MKIKFLLVAAAATALGLTSCGNEDAKLAGELVGTWHGTATEMTKEKKDKSDKDDHKEKRDKDERGAEAGRPGHMNEGAISCTPTFTFARTGDTNGGTIDISADYTVTKGVESVAVAAPVVATVNGNVKASGTWTVKDGDEVILTLDPEKTVVVVDTTSVALSYGRLTDAPQDSLAAVKARVVPNISDVVKPMLESKIQKMRKLDDVEIVGKTMTLEVGQRKMTLTKQ